MKYIFSILIVCLYLLSCNQKAPRVCDSYVIEKDNLYGIIDSLGNEIIPAKYLYARPFSMEGNALVVLDTIITHKIDTIFDFTNIKRTLNIKYGYVNTLNEFIFEKPSIGTVLLSTIDNVQDKFEEFCLDHSFRDGLALIEDYKTGLKGYINVKGDTVISAQYNDAKYFNEGIAPVQLPYNIKNREEGGKWGFIDKNGNRIGNFTYSQLTVLRQGRANATITYNSYEDYSIDGELSKDKDGNVVVDKSKKKSIKREEGDAPSIGWANYLVDKKGQIIKQTGMLRHYFNFSDDGISLGVPNQLGQFLGIDCEFIKTDGSSIKPATADDFSEEETQRIINSGTFIGLFEPDWKIVDATRFGDGYAAITLNNEKWIFVDKDLIIRGTEENYLFDGVLPFNHGLAGIKKDGKWGYIDTKFERVIECQYDSCCIAGRNLCKVILHNGNDDVKIVSYITRKNEVVWQNVIYNDFSHSQQNVKSAKEIGKWKEDIEYNYVEKNNYSMYIVLALIFLVVLFYILKRKRELNNNVSKEHKNLESSSSEMVTIYNGEEPNSTLDNKCDTEDLISKEEPHSEYPPKEETNNISSLDDKLDDYLQKVLKNRT